MQTFATPAPVAAVLDIPAGRIHLIAADRTDTTVEIRPANAAKSSDVRAAERIAVAYEEGVLHIGADKPANRLFGHSGAVEVTVQLPAGSRIEATTAAADLRGVGRLGDVVVEGARGTVKLDETAGARLTLQSGGITVGRLGGSAELTTQSGDLTVSEAMTGTVTLRTRHGDISVGATRGAAASLDAGTPHGRIHNTLRNAEGAGAAIAIHATTDSGNITARSL